MQKLLDNKWVQKPVTPHQMLLLSSLFPVALTLFRVLYTGQGLFLFLVWNLFLAWIPYLISRNMFHHLKWLENNFRFAAATTAWILFLPNSFYIITDLFHLEPRPSIPFWFDLALIFSFCWNGLLLGILSVRQMEKMVQVKFQVRWELLFVLPVMALNAFGIYVGRYLRYNSWDVVSNPLGLFQDLLYLVQHPFRNRFDWSMIVCYTVLLTIVYGGIKRMREIN